MSKSRDHKQAVQAEFERLQQEQAIQLAGGTFAHRFYRVITRALRVLAGLLLLMLAVYSCTEANSRSSVPISSLTVSDLGVLILGFVAVFAAPIAAFHVAFGESTSSIPKSESSLRAEAERRIAALEQERSENAIREAHEQERVAAWYRRNRLLGLLFDPGIAKRHKWLPWVAWPLTYLLIYFVAKRFA